MDPQTLVKTASLLSSFFTPPNSDVGAVGPKAEVKEKPVCKAEERTTGADCSGTPRSVEKESSVSRSSRNTDLSSGCGVETTVFMSSERETLTKTKYEHLVVMVHGVSGDPDNFAVLKEVFERQVGDKGVLFVRSQANRKEGSHDGVEICGKKLAREVQRVVDEHRFLKRISFVAFSIGGLFARYASGVGFDPTTKKMFGLEPCHYLSIATPHLGCHVEGEAQVPFIGWGLRLPYIDVLLRPIFDLLAISVTKFAFGVSGQHLFLDDGDSATEPAVLKLVLDIPGEGQFFSALAQFRTRTCYANACGDALVGWANASIRKEKELPRAHAEELELMGVVSEAPLHAGKWGDHHRHKLEDLSNLRDGQGTGQCVGDFLILDRKGVVKYMLSRLQTLPWCRIDVAFKNTFLAHTNIIVARKEFDSIGMPMVEHMAHRFLDLEEMVEARTL